MAKRPSTSRPDLQIRYRAPSDLKPYDKNSRTHSEAQVALVAESASRHVASKCVHKSSGPKAIS